MKRRKNLERAIVLGLLLSTSVYGNAWAEDGIFENGFNKVVEEGNLEINTEKINIGIGFNGIVNVVDGNLTVNAASNAVQSGYTPNATVTILANEVVMTSGANGIFTTTEEGYRSNVFIGTEDKKITGLTITAVGQGIDNKNGDVYIYGKDNSSITISANNNGKFDWKNSSYQSAVNNACNGDIIINAGSIFLETGISEKDKLFGGTTPVYGDGITNSSGTTVLNSNKVIMQVTEDGIDNSSGSVKLNTSGTNLINSDENAVYSHGSGTIDINATKDANINSGISTLKDYYDYNNNLYGDLNGVKSTSTGTTNVIADNNNNISGKENGIYTTGKGIINVEAGFINNINSDIVNENGFGTTYAVDATKGTVNLKAGLLNTIYGSVYASSKDANVNIKNLNEEYQSENYVYSAAVIENAGDIDTKTQYDKETGEENKFYNKKFVSSLYAENGAHIELAGENHIGTWADFEDNYTLERAVWAYSDNKQVGSSINLTGAVDIRTNSYDISPDSADVAVAAGTATGLNEQIVNEFGKNNKDQRSVVNINYTDTGKANVIEGDILAAYAGEVNINPLGENSKAVNNAGIYIKGNLLAGNNGVLDVNLGKDGVLIGRADDYGDAGVVDENGHGTGHGTIKDENGNTFYNPAFSSDIYKGGDVTLHMGDGSRWNVQGQSWITNVNTNGDVTIDLTSAETAYQNYNSHALTIRNLNGDANIKMNLDGERSQSDMLYIGQGNGEYNVELAELVTVEDMYANLDDNTKFSGLRFATVGKGSDVKFNVTAKGQGFNNVVYTVDTDVYNSAESKHENNAYNGENMSEEKPGNSLVEDLLNGSQTASTESGVATLAANDIMLLADEAETVNENEDNHLNYKLVAMQSDGLTDAGKTMLNMSRANYSNAIYMDRLNKRLGEARYINDDPEEDEGMWVRIRHDRIGKEDAFRSQNTMYELGYDKRQECDNGKRRVGFAVDYMHGDTGYSDIAGKGEIDRYGLWLYDTWTGNKGHYVDYVAKWGHLQNDFEVYNMGDNEKVTGDYSNNVFSISAEYGRKKDMGNDWYIEPQAQLQLARVTGADYVTSQGTKVSVDGINSLIGRAGFRLGKDFGEEKQSTVYFKADVLHEFLGDQTIRALDGTTGGDWQSVDYENKGTWYDIGIGYAAMLSQSTYAFIDLEQSFGNDNDDTYQINAGMQWSF